MTGHETKPILVVGAGLTGLTAALDLVRAEISSPIVVLERDRRVGGKASTDRREGHVFDITGHWLHLRSERVRGMVDELFAPGDLVEIERRTGVYCRGVMLPYPFQANLFGLPTPIVRDCLVDFIGARSEAASSGSEPRTFEDFVVARFGRAMAEQFFIPYNRKLWGDAYDSLTPSWVSRFVPLPDVEQVVAGALGLRQEGLGYNARFSYPREGGIDALAERLARAIVAGGGRIELGQAVAGVDPRAKAVRLGDGRLVPYERLISTAPLVELMRRIEGVPDDVARAAGRLRSVRWRYLNVATRTRPPLDEHWVYVPAPEVPFFRVGVFSNALPAMAPPGEGSLYVELADRDAPPDIPAILTELASMRAITSPGDVKFTEVRDIEHAYVVFDADHRGATELLHDWLARAEIRSCGRYGGWVYHSMEDSMLAGMEAATWASG